MLDSISFSFLFICHGFIRWGLFGAALFYFSFIWGLGWTPFEIAFIPFFGLLSGFRHYALDATMRVYELALLHISISIKMFMK